MSLPATVTTSFDSDDEGNSRLEELVADIFSESKRVLETEPVLANLLRFTVLAEDDAKLSPQQRLSNAISHTVCYRLLSKRTCVSHKDNGCGKDDPPVFCPHALVLIFQQELSESIVLEYGHTMLESVTEDIRVVVGRDPAMDTPLQVMLYSKGWSALVCHRAAHRLIQAGQEYTALYLQSICSAVFGVDIHPRAVIGKGVMLDHGTGIVIGETAVVGDGCTLLHGVTLGGTGKDHGDRHPKVGDSALIGAGSSILGNIKVGAFSKIGAGSVVLREIPAHSTAVGAPAKIVGRVGPNERPGSDVDETLEQQLLPLKNGDDTVSLASALGELSLDGTHASNDPMCPWRDVVRLGQQAPAGTITLGGLKNWMSPQGCTMSEIGAFFLALDDFSNVRGYICPKQLKATTGCSADETVSKMVSLMQDHTNMGEKGASQLVQKMLENCAKGSC